MTRTREQELQDSLSGWTVEEARVTGDTVLLRLSHPDSEEDAFVCFDERSFADAAAIWPG